MPRERCHETVPSVTMCAGAGSRLLDRSGLDSTAAGGEVAVYAGFGLEQTQRSARGVDLTMPLCHQIVPEPFCAFRLSPIFASKSPVNQLWC